MAKLYQYEEFRKLNQALNSFKRNGVPVTKVDVLTVGDKVMYFVLTDPKYEPNPEKKVKPKKEEKKKEIKKEVKKEIKIKKKKQS